ncbi:hypothetical protein [Streptomyces californicus]|uniref:deazapurine DNA modification protein DpdA family protein n=1 Tax=Streptomyces californicus TaxID=67351 RepID=UPI0037B5BE9D
MRYLVDRSGRIPSYLAPAPPELTAAGWIARDGVRLELTAAGSAALDAWEHRRATSPAQPFGLTRSPARGELHDPGEPSHILRDRASGREIRPGEIVTDPSGHPALYAGPSMTSADGGATWMPGFNARVRYAEFGGYIRIHAFRFKKAGLRLSADSVVSADSLAWSYGGRHEPGCSDTHRHENNCPRHALWWRQDLLDHITDDRLQR